MSEDGLLEKAGGGGGRAWPWALAAAGFLIYFLWAGSSWDPRHTLMWTYSPEHWLVPAPGIPHFLSAGLLLGGALMMLAARALACGGMRPVGKILATAVILGGGLLVRVWVIRSWQGWDLTPAELAARKLMPVAGVGGWAVIADMITLIFLVAAQWGKAAEGKSVWLAAVYAFHPVALLAIARGDRWLAILPAVVILAMLAPRLKGWVRFILLFGAAAACVVWLGRVAGTSATAPFDGAVAVVLGRFGVPTGSLQKVLVIGGALAEALIVILAMSRRWSVARAWGHMLAVWAIFSPAVLPMDVLPMIVLLPLAWVNAGAILSVSILLAYGITLSWAPGDAWALPLWVIFLCTLPAAVVELEELAREVLGALAGRMRPRPKAAGKPAAA